VVAAVVPGSATQHLVWIAIVFEIFWTCFIPLYNRYGTKHPANHTHTADFKRVGTFTESESGKTLGDEISEKQDKELTPHLSFRTKGTEYQWKWTDWFALFKISKYGPALNIEHWSERLGAFAVICLGEMVSFTTYDDFPIEI
jgi:hypothetical protein